MNILFALYGDFNSNSANPLVLYARELHLTGHSCAVAVPSNLQSASQYANPAFVPILYRDVLAEPDSVFPDGRPADVIHACTPREVVRRFVTSYMARWPTPLVIYLEDNESWISTRMMGLDENTLVGCTEEEISDRLPAALAHPFRYDSFIGLADAVAVIQDKLRIEVPPWVHCETVMIGVDVDFFSPRPADTTLRKKYGVAEHERVIVYHGGLDTFKNAAIETLCNAVGLMNRQGHACRLLRTGLRPLAFLRQMPDEVAAAICDLGVLPKHELPDLLALADVFVQPGRIDPFEDLRLPGKVPEFLAMGRPVVMPDVNIAHLFRDGEDAVLLRSGTAEEIAEKCIGLFSDSQRAGRIGGAGRILAEKYFDVRNQARRLEGVYVTAQANFNRAIAPKIWRIEDEDAPIQFMLARKLRLLADSHGAKFGIEAGEMLREHARYIELVQRRMTGLDAAMAERDGQIAALKQVAARHDSMLGSASWKVSAPIRWLGYFIRRIPKLAACLAPLWRDPRKIPSTAMRLRDAWDRGGMLAVNQLLLQLPAERSFNDVWLQYRRTFTPAVEADVRERIGRMVGRPLISILMPVYNTPEGVLRKTMESVLAQVYPDWELCAVDDASPQSELRRLLEEFAARDGRIRVEFCERNGGVALATNRALAMARGVHVALLDHDDVLETQALFRLAESILADDPDMIYSDEAMLSEDGVEVADHVYRPAFSPERLRSCPYIGHLVAFRTEFLRGIGGLDASLANSQDYDLMLRASEKARAIVHIPEILYLSRQRKSSTSHRMKEEVMETSRHVLARHLARCGERGEVRNELLFNYYDVRYPIEPGHRVAIIIPTKNHGRLVRQCVESIERTVTGVPYEIVVIDHASTDPESLAYFRQLSDRHRLLRYEGPFNFSAINNWAVAQLDGEHTHYLFCNNDIQATEMGWLERMMELCQKPTVGMVGAKLLYPDGRTLQHAGVCVGMFGIAEHYAKFLDERLPYGGIHSGYHGSLVANHEVSAVTAACALMRRDAFERVGGFAEAMAVGFGDVDLCLRTMKAGYRILFCPHASLIHHESFTRGKNNHHPQDSALFARKWRKFLQQGDPYYNPNLTLYGSQWQVRLPMVFNLDVGRRVIHPQPFSQGLAGSSRSARVA